MNNKKKQVSVLFLFYCMLFCVCLITANVLETKLISFGPINITGGILIFPISYIINDCVCEVWGFRKARLLIWLCFAMNFLFVIFGAIVDAIPGAPYWHNDDGFHAIFGLVPRITAASFVAFITGSFINAYIMSRMKIMSKGKHFSLRAVVSTLFGEAADSIVFFPLAFFGVVPANKILPLIVSQIVLKTLYEVVALPVTIWIVKMTKKHEETDVYDNDVNYNIWHIGNI